MTLPWGLCRGIRSLGGISRAAPRKPEREAFNPPDISFELTKAQASLRHIEQAIAAFEQGLFDVAITLAGAAEGMSPETPAPNLFKVLLEHPRVATEGTPLKEWNAALNMERDWLKHTGPTHAPSMTFDRSAAAIMLVRAISKAQAALGCQSDTIETFQAWITKHVETF
jgi:hypothetical protein